jgi:hypothetical protein
MEMWKTLVKPRFPHSHRARRQRRDRNKCRSKNKKEAVFDRIQKETRFRASIINLGGDF